MITPDLIEYIEGQQKKNISKEVISAGLLKAGWETQDIEEGFSKLKLPAKVQTPVIQATAISSDPYRESPIDSPKVSTPVFSPIIQKTEPPKVWSKPETTPTTPTTPQFVSSVKIKEDFIPTLIPKVEKPSISNTAINPNPSISPVVKSDTLNLNPNISKTAMLSSFQKDTDSSVVYEDKPSGVSISKVIVWISIILVIVVVIAITSFAFVKGFIKIPEFGSASSSQQIANQLKQIDDSKTQIANITNDLNTQKLAIASMNADLLVSKDQNIKFAIKAFVPVAKTFYSANSKSYGKASNTDGNCVTPAQGSLFAQVSPINSDVNIAINTLLPFVNNVASCYSNKNSWALSAPLASDATTFFCADSTGFLKETKVPLTDTICK